MTLRAKVIVYLTVLHLALAVAAFFILMERRTLLFVVEALFAVLVIGGAYVVRASFVPLDLIRTGAELMIERDFSSHFVHVGQPEMDILIDVYNGMVDRLREERLTAEEQHQLLQKISAASPAAIVICDFDDEIAQMNPAAERLMTPELKHQLSQIAVGESRLVAHHGNRRLKVSRAEFRDRGFAKSFFVIEEMTEELRLTEKSAYEKLIRMMSHEVNNSVGAVRSLLESLLRYAPQVGESDRGDFTSAVTIASSRVDALNRFMSAFADVVRIPPPTRTPTLVAEIVERVAALLRPELEDRGIRVDLDLSNRGTYDVDGNQLEQVILNVFRNAIEAVGRDGEIRATMEEGELVIADSGPGLAESVRDELFTPFFTTKRDGRGLGLTIVQEILANHALPFSLANGEGGGAEFRISF